MSYVPVMCGMHRVRTITEDRRTAKKSAGVVLDCIFNAVVFEIKSCKSVVRFDWMFFLVS